MRQGEIEIKPVRSVASAVRVSLLLGLVFCTTGASCTRTMRSPFAAWQPPAPQVLMTGSSLDQVITAVNANAARIQSIQTNNASITVPGMPGIPLLGGKIAAQRPGRFHLVAGTALTGDEVDMGSNDELFWFWVKRNEPPALFYARHNQFAGSAAQRLMPIEPQWLLDAIGFTEFRPGDVHTGPTALGNGKVEIQSVMQTRTGQLTKRTVVDATRAWVLEQHVYDAQGTLIASAVAKSHKFYQQANISLARRRRDPHPRERTVAVDRDGNGRDQHPRRESATLGDADEARRPADRSRRLAGQRRHAANGRSNHRRQLVRSWSGGWAGSAGGRANEHPGRSRHRRLGDDGASHGGDSTDGTCAAVHSSFRSGTAGRIGRAATVAVSGHAATPRRRRRGF